LEGVVDAREVPLRELRVERAADDLRDLAVGGHGVPSGSVTHSRAAAPPMISVSSVVICDWGLRLYVRPSALIMSFALSVADFIAVMRATCSETAASRNAWKRRTRTARGMRSERIVA